MSESPLPESTSAEPGPAPRALRLRTRILLGTVLLVGLFAVSVIIAGFAFGRIRAGLGEFSAASRSSTAINAIDRDALEIRQSVLSFTHDGREADAERVFERGGELDARVAAAIEGANDATIRDHLERMRTHLGTYLENFAKVAEERGLREQLVRDRIVEPTREIKATLAEIASRGDTDPRRSATGEAGDAIPVETARQTLANTTLAEVSALQFLTDPDSRRVREGLAALRKAIADLEAIEADTPVRDRLVERLREFEQGFLRSVQATRGYLYLAHVVMAGEASEFAFHSAEVRRLAATRLATINGDAVRTTESASRLVSYASLAAGLIGLLAAFAVVRSIVRPISAITRTFNALSQGEVVASVPGLERGDEIGDMARAADVFRNRNRQTLELLADSQRMATELDERAEQLARSNRDLDSFAYVASHDLKSPLRGIDNLAAMIEEDAGDALPAESLEHFGMLRQRVGRMDRLLDDLLAYSRAGREKSEPVEVDTAELVQEIVGTLDWPAEMEIEIAPDLPHVTTVRITLQRVLHNLLTNAVKYRADDAPRVTVSANPVDDERVEFAVADNGIGIAPQFQDGIFEMFRRLHTHDAIEGSGMGLALVKRLVHGQGGDISVESAEGEGATFRFTWPRVERSENPSDELTLVETSAFDPAFCPGRTAACPY